MKSIIQRMEEGDFSPLRELYSGCLPGFIKWSRAEFSCSYDDAMEVFQEAVIEIYNKVRNGSAGEIKGDVIKYLYGICSNKLCNRIRHDKIHACFCEKAKKISAAGHQNEYETEIEKEHLSYILDQKLKCLNPRNRYLLQLAYIEEMNREDIAAIMNFPNAKAVCDQLCRILKMLRKKAGCGEKGTGKKGKR
jgi:RNA polymerase sigma factor (sigma-70 family)